MKILLLGSLLITTFTSNALAKSTDILPSKVEHSNEIANITSSKEGSAIHIVATMQQTEFKVGYLSDESKANYIIGIKNDSYEVSFSFYDYQSPEPSLISLEDLLNRGQFDAWKIIPMGYEAIDDIQVSWWLEENTVHMVVEGDFADYYDMSKSRSFIEVSTEADDILN